MIRRLLIRVMSSPSTRMRPESGRIRPMMCLSSTDFPEPEAPRMTWMAPFSTVRFRPRRTWFFPKDLWRSTTSMTTRCIGPSGGAPPGEHQRGQKVIRDENEDRGEDDRLGGGDPHPPRAARGVVALVAAGEREDEAEDRGFDEAADDVLELHPLGDAAPDLGHREVLHVHRHEGRREDGDH